MSSFFHRTWLTLAATALASASAHAQVISLSTGLAANGSTLAAGTVDPFWTIRTVGNFYSPSQTVVMANGLNAACGCGIITNSSAGQWISDYNSIANGWGINQTVYVSRSFDLTGYDLNTVVLNGFHATMDSNIGLFINGTLIPGTTALYPGQTPWMALTHFTASSGFLQTNNTIEFRATSSNAVWDGVHLSDTFLRGHVNANVAPEPASVVLLASGLIGMGVVVRRKRER